MISSEWDGLVRELLEQRADLAVADLTITFDREQVNQLMFANEDDTYYYICIAIIFICFCFPGGRFYDAIYEFRHISFISETGQATTKFIFIFIAALARRMDLHGHGLFRCISTAIHFGTVGSN